MTHQILGFISGRGGFEGLGLRDRHGMSIGDLVPSGHIGASESAADVAQNNVKLLRGWWDSLKKDYALAAAMPGADTKKLQQEFADIYEQANTWIGNRESEGSSIDLTEYNKRAPEWRLGAIYCRDKLIKAVGKENVYTPDIWPLSLATVPGQPPPAGDKLPVTLKLPPAHGDGSPVKPGPGGRPTGPKPPATTTDTPDAPDAPDAPDTPAEGDGSGGGALIAGAAFLLGGLFLVSRRRLR